MESYLDEWAVVATFSELDTYFYLDGVHGAALEFCLISGTVG